MPEKVSAGGLLDSLKKSFGLGKKQSAEVPAAVEMPAAPPPAPVLEPAPTTMLPEAAATEIPSLAAETVVPAVEAPAPVAEDGLPEWLRAGEAAERELWPLAPSAPLPEPEAPVAGISAVVVEEPPVQVAEAPTVLPAAETPMPPVEARVEADPFAVNKEFNGYMETIRQAQAVLASGIALTPEEQKKALIAVAKSNSLLPKLPPEVLESVLLMRAVAANNPDFSRNDFQIEMLAAMDIVKTGVASK